MSVNEGNQVVERRSHVSKALCKLWELMFPAMQIPHQRNILVVEEGQSICVCFRALRGAAAEDEIHVAPARRESKAAQQDHENVVCAHDIFVRQTSKAK
eukprot:32852-Rhodomonas_salina.2